MQTKKKRVKLAAVLWGTNRPDGTISHGVIRIKNSKPNDLLAAQEKDVVRIDQLSGARYLEPFYQHRKIFVQRLFAEGQTHEKCEKIKVFDACVRIHGGSDVNYDEGTKVLSLSASKVGTISFEKALCGKDTSPSSCKEAFFALATKKSRPFLTKSFDTFAAIKTIETNLQPIPDTLKLAAEDMREAIRESSVGNYMTPLEIGQAVKKITGLKFKMV